jgi:hypothetical protein
MTGPSRAGQFPDLLHRVKNVDIDVGQGPQMGTFFTRSHPDETGLPGPVGVRGRYWMRALPNWKLTLSRGTSSPEAHPTPATPTRPKRQARKI